MPNKSLAEAEYNQFRLFLEQHSGIVLGENKQYLVRSRLAPLMGKYNLPSLSDVVKHSMKPTERALRAEVIDAIGDMVVVLTILAEQRGVAIEDCMAAAWDEIKDRKGTLVNGIFIKEES